MIASEEFLSSNYHDVRPLVSSLVFSHWFCLKSSLFLFLFFHWWTVNFLPKIIFDIELVSALWQESINNRKGSVLESADVRVDTSLPQCTPQSPWGWVVSLLMSFSRYNKRAGFSQAINPQFWNSRATFLQVGGPSSQNPLLWAMWNTGSSISLSSFSCTDSVSHWGMESAGVVLSWPFVGFILHRG